MALVKFLQTLAGSQLLESKPCLVSMIVLVTHKHAPARYIPAGTQVYVPPFSLHRDPRYFSPSPDAFIPDRWLSSTGQSTSQSAFIPFSYGPANCVGRQMAKQEMLMFASVLLQTFDFTFAPSFEGEQARKWEEKRFDFLVTTRDPLIVRVKTRA